MSKKELSKDKLTKALFKELTPENMIESCFNSMTTCSQRREKLVHSFEIVLQAADEQVD